MKRKLVAIPLIAASLVFIIAYSTIEKTSPNRSAAPAVAKKPLVVKKVKPQKKKSKNKSAVINNPGTKSLPEENKKIEAEQTSSTHSTVIRNIVVNKINNYALENNLSTEYCFLVDMSMPSGRNRFFVYDLKKNSVIQSGLVAHGSCNETFLARPRFSNESKSGCSSLGKYQVGEFYRGKYGKSYRLMGLDNCNSNAYKRAVVIHGYDCVPDEEIYPRVLCNSLGCVMISYKFFDKISRIINKSEKPIVLWIYQ